MRASRAPTPSSKAEKREQQRLQDEELQRCQDLPGGNDAEGGQQKQSAGQRIEGERSENRRLSIGRAVRSRRAE